MYLEKALDPKLPTFQPSLYIDFEAMNMRICGWYAELICEHETVIYEGIAKPYSDTKYVTRLWNKTYQELLPYSVEQLCSAKHIRSYEKYFIDMFVRAKRIYTYGDTDALFVKKSFGNDLFNFFKVKNIDASVKIGNRQLSLEKTCKLFGIHLEGAAHNPKYDVKRMQAYIEAAEQL